MPCIRSAVLVVASPGLLPAARAMAQAPADSASVQWSVPSLLPPGALLAVVRGDPTAPGECPIQISCRTDTGSRRTLTRAMNMSKSGRERSWPGWEIGSTPSRPVPSPPAIRPPHRLGCTISRLRRADRAVGDVHRPLYDYLPPGRGRPSATRLSVRVLITDEDNEHDRVRCYRRVPAQQNREGRRACGSVRGARGRPSQTRRRACRSRQCGSSRAIGRPITTGRPLRGVGAPRIFTEECGRQAGAGQRSTDRPRIAQRQPRQAKMAPPIAAPGLEPQTAGGQPKATGVNQDSPDQNRSASMNSRGAPHAATQLRACRPGWWSGYYPPALLRRRPSH
jgi:hypothetical protein